MRDVQVLAVDPARAAHLAALAEADHPRLQAVCDVDRELGQAILEHPRREPLRPARVPLGERPRILRELRSALAALHERGLAHGQVSASHVLHGPGRALLLLPDTRGGDSADDLRALERLFADG